MKHLLTFTALLISSLAMGQFPNLPYNPDDNADGLIGVADLQTLLANYGQEFSSAVVSEDGESAIVYIGDLPYALCANECKSLPGQWQIPDFEDLGLVWDEVYDESSATQTWLKRNESHGYLIPSFRSNQGSNSGAHEILTNTYPRENYRCYCAAKQIPRVEYDYCEGFNIQECISLKVSEGWLPLGATESEADNCQCGIRYHQSFWRWAE